MSEMANTPVSAFIGELEPIGDDVWKAAEPYVAKFVWNWYAQHKDDVLTKIGGLPFLSIHVSVIEPILEHLFGPAPVASVPATPPATPPA